MKRLLAVVALVGIFSLLPVAPAYSAEATCTQPTSDAAALYVASNQSPRRSQAYWWSKTNLTIGIFAARNVDPDHYAAVERAIRTWQMTIDQCLGGAVSLTYVPVSPGATAKTDIVIRLVPHAGGFAFAGLAECGPSGCNNVIVSYMGPPGRSPSGSEQPLWATKAEPCMRSAMPSGLATPPILSQLI